MGTRKLSSIEIKPGLLKEGQNVELQRRTDCFLLIGRLKSTTEKYPEEQTQLIKQIAKDCGIEGDEWGYFRKEFGDFNTPVSEVYDSIQRMISAMAQFENEKNVMTTVSAKVPIQIGDRLKNEKNASEIIRIALERFYEQKK